MKLITTDKICVLASHHTLIYLLSFLSTLIFSTQALALVESMFIDPIDGHVDASNYLTENAYGFLPVPIIITDPAVGGGLGLTGLFFHEDDAELNARQEAMRSSDNASIHLIPPNVSFIAAAATGNQSYMGAAGHLGFFKQGNIRYLGFAGAADINLDFYGSGDGIVSQFLANNPIDIKTEAAMTSHHVKFRMPQTKVFLGPKFTYITSEVSINDFSLCQKPAQICNAVNRLINDFSDDFTTTGLGLIGQWDSRTNFFSPQEGYNIEIEYMIFDDAIGSDLNYEQLSIKDLNYWKINDQFRTNLRLDWQATFTDETLPPFAIPGMVLRGIPAMKYQGERIAVVELEFIWQMNYRWSVSVFGGSGRAAEETRALKYSNSINTQGLGFRYRIARRYGFDMGIDIAQGPDDRVFYIQAGSSW